MSTNFVPDPKKHLQVSIAKSVLRIVGYIFICAIPAAAAFAYAAGALLIAAEGLGIVEELV